MVAALRPGGWEHSPPACRQAVEALAADLPGQVLASMVPKMSIGLREQAAAGLLARCAGPWPAGLAEPVGALLATAGLVGGPAPAAPTTMVLAAAAAPPLRAALEATARDEVAAHPAAALELTALLALP